MPYLLFESGTRYGVEEFGCILSSLQTSLLVTKLRIFIFDYHYNYTRHNISIELLCIPLGMYDISICCVAIILPVSRKNKFLFLTINHAWSRYVLYTCFRVMRSLRYSRKLSYNFPFATVVNYANLITSCIILQMKWNVHAHVCLMAPRYEARCWLDSWQLSFPNIFAPLISLRNISCIFKTVGDSCQ